MSASNSPKDDVPLSGIVATIRHNLRQIGRRLGGMQPTRLLSLGYASYIIVAWMLLCLPLCWESEPISALDNLFTATSALSTTGLITVNTPVAYNWLGELIVLIAIQFGGLGYMTLGSFVLLARRREISEMRESVGQTAFSLPEGFEFRVFIRHVVVFTVVIEAAGAAALFFAFMGAGVEKPFWPAVFHSISAFCTAGFSVFPNSLEDFRANFWVNAIISALSIGGAIGFLVFSDVWLWLTRRRERTTYTTRIILWMTAWLIVGGAALIFLIEPTLRDLPPAERLMTAWFQSMTSVTTVGFNTHAIGAIGHAAALIIIVQMIIGAAPAGTGGGLKVTSLSAALAVVGSRATGRREMSFLGSVIPPHRIHGAFAALVFYVMTFLAGSFLLLLVQSQSLEDVLFEAASALGTVGLSRGITADLSALGKIIVIALMFVGRVGPLTFGLALFAHPQVAKNPGGVEDVAM